MHNRSKLLAVVGTTLAVFALSAPAHAQATRTFVSGVGNDADPCSRTAPCKTFAGAISKTFINGEIDCLDAGGFGTLLITKSITLDCTSTMGSISQAAPTASPSTSPSMPTIRSGQCGFEASASMVPAHREPSAREPA